MKVRQRKKYLYFAPPVKSWFLTRFLCFSYAFFIPFSYPPIFRLKVIKRYEGHKHNRIS